MEHVRNLTHLTREEYEERIKAHYRYMNIPDDVSDMLCKKYSDDINVLYLVATPETLAKWMIKQYWYEQHPQKRKVTRKSSTYQMMLH